MRRIARARARWTPDRTDDALAFAALAVVAILCASFRYLPMVDLPQHYAMVSIMAHHSEPAWGFAQRYTFDFVGRPYATVYWLGAALVRVMPLSAAMRAIVALCTIAPLAGAHALLAATGRSRVWLLAAIPFAFGSIWHWGFLNFLLGTGLFASGLALVVLACTRKSCAPSFALLALGPLLLFTHFHGLVMLLLFAPVFAWTHRGAKPLKQIALRAIAPLVPAAVLAAAFVLLTWRQAQGRWDPMSPTFGERVARFPEFLGAGMADPWPLVWLAGFAVLGALGFALGDARPPARPLLIAFAIALAGQVAMYFVLPLNTSTATYVSARHALLCVLFALPLLPSLQGKRLVALRAMCAAWAALALVVSARHLACFDREARDFDGVLAPMKSNKRVATLMFARSGACMPPKSFPYLHFAAYYQARRGGELARSFAVVWNVPIRYRADYARYPIREQIEWAPHLFSREDLAHFDYVLVRGQGAPSYPPELGVREVARSGAWTLLENTTARAPELPAP
jgi:hypothetical protein